MSLRSWLQMFVTTGTLAWSVGIVNPSTAGAQPPAPPPAATAADATEPPAPGDVPRLPDVNVVAEPPAVNLQPNFEPFSPVTLAADNAFTAPPFSGYRAESSNVGSLINMPDLRMPGTVSVIGKDLIRDQQALRMSDVIRDIGGAASGAEAFTGRPDAFTIRGLEVQSYNMRKNGFQDPTYTPRDLQNVERIDVFKGPASVMYGPTFPSGTVNVITKKAQQDRFAFGGMTFGSYGLNRYVTDVNTMNRAGDILFRINTAYENRGSFRDSYYNNRVFVAPTLTMLLSEDTTLTWDGEYLQDNRRYDSGIIAVNGNTRALPASQYYGTLDDVQHFHDYRSTLSLVHKFSDDWQFYLGGSTLFYDAPYQGTTPSTSYTFPGPVPNPFPGAFYTGETLFRTQSYTPNFAEQNHAVITNLSGVFNTGRLVHHAISGFEGNWQVTGHERFYSSSFFAGDPTLAFDPFSGYANGSYGGGTISQSSLFDVPSFRTTRFGFYQQDYIDVTSRFHVLLGQRFDTVNIVYDRNNQFPVGNIVLGPTYTNDTINRWSPRAGLVYEWVPGALSSYATYTTAFSPPSGGNSGATPETAQIWEGGFKANIFDDLTFTVGGFYIERQNASVLVSTSPTLVFDQSGVQRSQGVEMNLVGQWTDRLSTVSNYTYNDVLQSGYENSYFGNSNGRVRSVPFNLANVWTRYNFIQESDRTLGMGLGWIYVGERRGDYNSPLVLSSYNRWDLGVYGRLKRWTMDAYIENIFDKSYDLNSISQFQIAPGAPTNFRLQIGVLF